MILINFLCLKSGIYGTCLGSQIQLFQFHTSVLICNYLSKKIRGTKRLCTLYPECQMVFSAFICFCFFHGLASIIDDSNDAFMPTHEEDVMET